MLKRSTRSAPPAKVGSAELALAKKRSIFQQYYRYRYLYLYHYRYR